jgi:hypothetical protein
MSTNLAADSGSFSVQGRIFDAVTKDGLANLLVTIYDIDKSIERASNSSIAALLKNAMRIGSVVSQDNGAFSFRYGREDIASLENGKSRLDLLLVVSAPDDESTASSDKVLYYSNPPRMNAGRVESFNIGITRATQKKFALHRESTIKDSISSYERAKIDEKELNDSIVKFHRAALDRDVKEKEILRKELLDRIATDARAVALTGELVKDNDNIKDKLKQVGNQALVQANTQINENRGVPVNLYLTPADRTRLQQYFNNAVDGIAVIPEHELQDILFRTNSSDNPGTLLVHQSPFAKYCAEQTFEEQCAKIHTGLEPEPGEHEHEGEEGGEEEEEGMPGVITGPGIATLTDGDIPRYVANLVANIPSPNSVLTPEFNAQHADKNAVEDAVDAFSLKKGPAEVPAFYDFHSLQIAFEHVWKILLDEDIINRAHTLDRKYRLKTGMSIMSRFPHNGVAISGDMVYESIPQEVPADVAAQFDISLAEWNDLSASHQDKLGQLATQIATACDPKKVSIGIGGILGIEQYRVPLDCEKRRQDLREQGDRIIDAVRHDDYFTLHKTLRELHDRINSNYEFTVFAADQNTYSVNFGLMNTYRQQWTPLNYQAGKLVKTIPLAPKEERKYTLKTSRTLKHVRKEALKNSSSSTTEQSSISRVEAEIMKKAQNKTNFGLSTEGTYNIGISKGKATTTFGVEAQQESAENRKDFREAVLKAVQEYKDERNIEIDTEESSSYEYTESGMVSNQNEEISATYLFYELQRRYRITEQLYRALPVVLVAQQVPAPHQITESWVISHDWIINRYLLDDSFRPALQYLANKSVGDDFALRELRKNLRQQRNLVDTLRVALSIASDEADNRYRALESAIEKRIGEESAEKTDGWFSDVGDFFGGGGQDPEAAKARELAAKDAHQYAVEKAEKAATALRQEVGNLHALTTEYNNTLRNHLDNETRVKRLLVHIRKHIFHYMQAIWSMEPPDQRFLRLHKVQVPVLELAKIPDPANPGTLVPNRHYRVEVAASDDIFAAFREPGTTKHKAFMTGTLKPITQFRPLVEVADLDNLLGFKGNYMIFPLKQHNALTEFMAAPYVDAAFGAMDPDELSNVNLADYGKYVCCLHDKLPKDKFDALKPQLKKWLELLLADPLRNGDEITVPTNSLFIEVLAGTHPLLENFKLRHRELDVYKAQADVRKAELENLRLAARLINDQFEDPDIDKKIVVEGGAHPAIDVDNP